MRYYYDKIMFTPEICSMDARGGYTVVPIYRNEQESHRVDSTFACPLPVEQFEVTLVKCVLNTSDKYMHSKSVPECTTQ